MYRGIETQGHGSYSSIFLSIFVIVYICRMSDCILGLRLRVMALIFLFLSIFLSFPILHVNIKNLCLSFLKNF